MKLLAVLTIGAACFAPQQSDSSSAANPAPATLLTTNRIEGLSEATKIVLATNYILNLDPGICARKTDDTVQLSTYDGAKIRLTAGGEKIRLISPAVARLTPNGWDLGMGRIYPESALRFSRDEQDDTDNNLKSMQESAKKLKSKTDNKQDINQNPSKKLKVRWLFGENPNPTAELFNTQAIQQLTHLSNIGF
jgi:hypothetical protein